ncbi:TetR/AcrR family transcriptional regulator [Labilibaculum sp. DW002]|jgi:AcrR family transcriptional regulator|uniref:TetR/AcrR family transcriptional regulator n=1 Tax=Paralabilibaculum antarcticum TaxID=2912572 RepID=A0ABT5VMF5_9BACT|nr:TetR/AcrR family transcriptional regulator [Labilibaculum sp. DW002]MDE5416604.1 TetR/AcrR family transcriptional regulator [Labilibaculum sp. DW002]
MKIGDKNIEKVVLNCTKTLLLQSGVKGWNMDDLARECGMSKRTLYKIIGNKEDLLYKCYSDNMDIVINSFKTYSEQDKDYHTLLENMANQQIEHVEEFIIVNFKTIKTEYPRIEAMIHEKLITRRSMLIDFLEEGKAMGYIHESVESRVITNIVSALMEFNINMCKTKTEFESKIREELKYIFSSIQKR